MKNKRKFDTRLRKIAISSKLPDYSDLIYVIEKMIFFDEGFTDMDKIRLHHILTRAKTRQDLRG